MRRASWPSSALAVLTALAVLQLAAPRTSCAGPGELLICLRSDPLNQRPSPAPTESTRGAAATPVPAAAARSGLTAAPAWLAAQLPATMAASVAAAESHPLLSPVGSRLDCASRWRLERTLLLRLPAATADVESIARALAALPEVEYCVPNRLIHLPPAPAVDYPGAHAPGTDDPRGAEQWYLSKIDIADAWKVTRGTPDVLIAVIDTGISRHVDLTAAIWENDDPVGNASSADDHYDQDGDGLVEDWERDDDDDNGYVDDTYGYDFVDAPRIGGPDDPFERDNDPTDGSGHGTLVAGLIAATADNGIGIAGAAPGCRVMAVRAGFNAGGCSVCGVLEEDDAAAALVYAADNGATVINMSWGDTLYSPVIADAVLYAVELGVTLVASGGNMRSDGVHYPSGLDGVVAVGASDQFDVPAVFTNSGPTLDLMAPGVGLLSTYQLDEYLTRSGTSFAAPLVAAVAGLLKSRDPTLTAVEVAAILTGGAEDLFPPGYDLASGHGRLDAGRALAIERRASARLVAPANGDGVDASVTVRATAEGLGLQWFELDWGTGRQPAQFTTLTRVVGRQAVADSVAVWNTAGLTPGEYTLRLRVLDSIDGLLEERVLVRVDHSAPAIDGEYHELLWVGEQAQEFIFFDTDDEARGKLLVRQGSPGTVLRQIDESYLTRHHTFRLPADLPPGEVTVELEAQNAAGLTGPEPPATLTIPLTNRRARGYAMALSAPTFAAGEVGPDPLDLNGNGHADLVYMTEVPETIYGPADIYEAVGDDDFIRQASLPIGLLPRGVGDSDGDGRAEIVGIGSPARGGIGTYLFESPAPGSYPTELVWADTTLAGFAMGFAELGGETAILAIRGDSLAVYRGSGDAAHWTREVVPNAAGSRASIGPTFFAADLDADGSTEVVVGDTDGYLLVYRDQQGGLQPVTAVPLPVAATPRVSGGRLGDPALPRIVTSQEFGLTFQSEALYERRRHIVSVLEFTADELRLDATRMLSIAGVEQGLSAVRLANVDGDPEDELVLAAAPDLYVFELGVDSPPAVWTPTFHHDGVRSRAIAIGDADGDGRVELFARLRGALGDDDRIATFEARDVTLPGPKPPDGLQARLLTPTVAQLSWNPGAPIYRVYRATAATLDCDLAFPIAQVSEPAYVDTALTGVELVTYRIQAVDEASRESACSESLTLQPGAAPRVVSVTALHARALQVVFSEPMDASADRLESYELRSPAGARLELSTALQLGGAHSRLLTMRLPFATTGEYALGVGEVRSVAGAPLIAGTSIPFAVGAELPPTPALYIRQATTAGTAILVELSAPPAPPAGLEPTSYSLSGGRSIATVSVEGPAVTLALDGGYPLASGVYQLGLAAGLVGTGGEVVVPGSGDLVALSVAGMIAYPNPYDARVATVAGVTFAGGEPGTEVVVLDAGGRQVARIQANAEGRATLNVRGNPALASGVYIYRMEMSGAVHTGKLAILR